MRGVGYIWRGVGGDPASPEAAPRQAGVVRVGEWRLPLRGLRRAPRCWIPARRDRVAGCERTEDRISELEN